MADAPSAHVSPATVDRTAAELAGLLNGRLVGDGATTVSRIDTLEDAGEHSIAWITAEQSASRATGSGASILVIPEGFPAPHRRCSIAVKDPELALCALLDLFDATDHAAPEGVHPSSSVHPSASVERVSIGAHAVVENDALVGAGTVLHAGAFIGAGVRIGEHCVIWNNVVVRAGAVLGDRVVIHPNTTIGADGFGYIFRAGRHVKVPQIGGVVIEDDVEIGAGCAIDRAKTGVTRIGQGTKIDNLVQIGHNVQIGRHCVIAGQVGIGGSSTLGDYCALGGQVGVSDHMNLGAGARVAAKSGVSRRVRPGEAMRGIPALGNKEFQQVFAAGRRLPRMLKAFKAMRARIEALEAALRSSAGASAVASEGTPEGTSPKGATGGPRGSATSGSSNGADHAADRAEHAAPTENR